MSKQRQLASTTRPMTFLLVSATDHITGATGLTPTVTISKDGGASFGSPSGAVTEMANGWYALAGHATDRNTLGDFIIHTAATASNDPSDEKYEVTAFDPFALAGAIRAATAQSGTTAFIKLDASASATNDTYNGSLVTITSGTGAGQTRTIVTYNGTSKNANVDRNWTTAPDNTSIFAILAADGPALNNSLQVTANVSQAVIRSGTAQTGSTTNTIKLDSGASATNNIYVGDTVTVTGGTGVGQTRTIIGYVGSTKVATVDRVWVTTPDNTSTFNVLANTTPTTFSDQGVAQAGASGSITLASTASSVNSVYVGSLVTILSGTDSGDTSEITAYNGTTKVATVSPNFAVAPDTTSAYAVIPTQSGTGALPGSQDVNVVTWASGPVSSTVTGIPVVDMGYIRGVASVGAAGYVGPDWGQVTNKTTTNALTGTTISSAQVVASVTGAVGSVTGAVGSVTGAVGSVTGAVGSVTGNVGGNVTGSIGSLAAQAQADVAAGWAAALLSACVGLPSTNGQALTYAIQQRNNKEHANKTTGAVTLYENDGVTVKSTQTYASDATTADRSAMA